MDYIKPDHEIELVGVNFDDPIQLEDNKTDEALNILRSYSHNKGRKRRNKLLELEMFQFEKSDAIATEHLAFKDNFMLNSELPNTHDILLHNMRNFDTLIKLQNSYNYDIKSLVFSVDMTEYYLSKPTDFDNIRALFDHVIVVIGKFKKFSDFKNVDSYHKSSFEYTSYSRVV